MSLFGKKKKEEEEKPEEAEAETEEQSDAVQTYVMEPSNIDAASRGTGWVYPCLLYTSPSPRDRTRSRMPSSA